MDAETAAKLREPFRPEQIGKLPRPTSKDNPKGHCAECGKYHGLPAVHLDYAGHAAVTDRLLQVDPEWFWEPVAKDPHTGAPLIVDGGLWIILRVAGVARYGYGDASMGRGVKEMIGDAIRNAAMRFGVGLDLWAKEDLGAAPNPDAPESPVPSRQVEPTPEPMEEKQRRRMFALVGDLAEASAPFPIHTPEDVATWDEWRKRYIAMKFGKHSASQLTKQEANHVLDRLQKEWNDFETARADIPFS